MTTLNKVKTNSPLENINNEQPQTNTYTKYQLSILIVQTSINIVLLIYIFFFNTATLIVKDTMLPVQYLKNIELIFELLENKTARKEMLKVYPKFYVGISLYLHHIKKINNEMKRYMKNLPSDFSFDVKEHKGKIEFLLQQVKSYETAENKEEALHETYNTLIKKIRNMETELTTVYSPQGYVPCGILTSEVHDELKYDVIKLNALRCRLVVENPSPESQTIYQQIEQHFNTLFQDQYVAFSLQFIQQILEQAV